MDVKTMEKTRMMTMIESKIGMMSVKKLPSTRLPTTKVVQLPRETLMEMEYLIHWMCAGAMTPQVIMTEMDYAVMVIIVQMDLFSMVKK